MTTNRRRPKRPKPQHHFPKSVLLGRYKFVRYLGHGSYGHVAEAMTTDGHPFLKSGIKVAIKKIPNVFDNEIDAKRLLRELRILRLLRGNETIVTVLDAFIEGDDISRFDTLLIVFEFVDTDLSKLFASDQFFGILHVQYIFYQLCLGLKTMHSANICHRDIKPSNILVNEDCTIKLCDFGLARCLTPNTSEPQPRCTSSLRKMYYDENHTKKTPFKRCLTRHVVTRWYRAPEVILLQQDRDLLPKIDVWAAGCILTELLQMLSYCVENPLDRKPFFPGKSCFPLSCTDPFAYNDREDQLNVIFSVLGTPSEQQIKRLKNEKAQKYLKSLPKKPPKDLKSRFPGVGDDALDLLTHLLDFNPETRYSLDEVFEHRFLENVRDINAEEGISVMKFDFEDVPLSLQTIRELLVDEILLYNTEYLPSEETPNFFTDQTEEEEEEVAGKPSSSKPGPKPTFR